MPFVSDLRYIRALRLVDENAHDGFNSPEIDHPPEDEDITKLFRRHGKHLEELAISGDMAETALRCVNYSSLTHLAITDARADISEKGLAKFLKSSNALESLIVVDCYDFGFLPISPLGSGERALPNLKDLKVYLRLPTSHYNDALAARDFITDSQRLLEFTALHSDLRRFDFSIEPVENGMSKKSLLTNTTLNDEWFPNIICAAEQSIGIFVQ